VISDLEPGESLLRALRDRLGLLGPKGACDQGECGACTVIMDGLVVCSCLVLAADASGSQVLTVEGLFSDHGLTDLQQAFVETGAVQCGFCTPGLIVTLHDLLERLPDALEATVQEAIAGNLCRCTGYGRILEAVRLVQERRRG
jgi:aerobic carbon-monoxide dehydrogenase small subunit